MTKDEIRKHTYILINKSKQQLNDWLSSNGYKQHEEGSKMSNLYRKKPVVVEARQLTKESIRENLATVFEKVTPAVSTPSLPYISPFGVKGPEFGNKPELITQCGSDLNRPVATWVNQQIPQPSHFFYPN